MIIYIEEYQTLIMGDILFSKSFPYIDLNNGGDIDGLIGTYKWIIKTFPQVEKIIAGHGPDMDLKSFTEYVQLLEESYELIKKSLKGDIPGAIGFYREKTKSFKKNKIGYNFSL